MKRTSYVDPYKRAKLETPSSKKGDQGSNIVFTCVSFEPVHPLPVLGKGI